MVWFKIQGSKKAKSLRNFAFLVDITKYYVDELSDFISLRLQVQPIFIHRLLHHGPVQHAGLDEFTTRTKLLHGFRLVELLLELLEGALDVVSFFDLNAEHVFLIGRQK